MTRRSISFSIRIVKTLTNLVIESENLKKQEEEFKSECKKEKENLERHIKDLEESTVDYEDPKEKERLKLVEEQLEYDNKKLHKSRLQLVNHIFLLSYYLLI